MSLIDDVRREQTTKGTSLDGQYIRRMEAALLAAEEVATVLQRWARPGNDLDNSAHEALAAYRKATGASQ